MSYVRVVLPKSATAGSLLNIQTDDGKEFQITVPDGSRPGDTISVAVPADAAVPTNSSSGEHSGNRKALGAGAVATVAGALIVGNFAQNSF